MAESGSVSPSHACPFKQHLIESKLEHLYTKLQENEITTSVKFTALSENELAELCHKLQLNDTDASKLKQFHQKQQDSMKSNKSNKSTKQPISPKKADNNLSQINDIQHILEKYFTEIEDGCNSAKNEIDQKFQEIITTLTNKQKQIHQQINEWKLNKLENVNKEISNIIQYKDECKSISENKEDEKYKKYKDSSELIKHIQSITPLISIDFDPETHKNIINGISSLTNINTKNYVSFPSIVLTKPQHFVDKNYGYSIKLKWSFRNYTNDINKDHIVLKYRTDQKDNDDDKKTNDMKEEWKVFKHGIIAMIKGENESIMESQLLDVLRVNQSYLCQIEYSLKTPIDIIIRSNIEQFINIKEELNKTLNKIKLEYYSHRKHSLTRHPKYLLLNSDTKQYWSSFNNDFKRDESDWIIFKYKDIEINKKWIPKTIIFKNYKSNQDVKKMIVYIGNIKTKEWYPLTKNPIQPKLSKELQIFNVDNFDRKLAQDDKYCFIKLEFLQNYGENNADMCRFCCRHFRLMGVS